MSQTYVPIDCGEHDKLELLCMRGAERIIRFQDGEIERTVTGRCRDLRVSGGEEFLVIDTPDGIRQVRLDHLLDTKAPCH